jgi:hypothetical protein
MQPRGTTPAQEGEDTLPTCPICGPGFPRIVTYSAAPPWTAVCNCVSLTGYGSREEAAQAWQEWDAKRQEQAQEAQE